MIAVSTYQERKKVYRVISVNCNAILLVLLLGSSGSTHSVFFGGGKIISVDIFLNAVVFNQINVIVKL